MNSLFYLEKLATPQNIPVFCEETEKEIHPIRRYIARTIDLCAIQVLFSAFLIIIVRIRPYINAPVAVLSPIIGLILSLPISALLLHTFGTTLGKWLMGIRLEDPNGGRLSLRSAFAREVNVLIAGYGFHIPIFKQIRLFICYRDVSKGKETEWDREAEIHYTGLGIIRILLTVISIALIFVLNYSANQDTAFPKYRSNNLTLEQFISNYHDYEKQFQNDNTMVLQEDGTWKKRTDYSVEITQIGDPNHIRKDFQYTFNEKGGIQTIYFKDSWNHLGMNTVLPDYCYTALFTVVASQKGVSSRELQELQEALNERFGRSLENGGTVNGDFTVHNVTFSWNAELAKRDYLYLEMIGGILVDSSNQIDNLQVPYTLEFVITIK